MELHANSIFKRLFYSYADYPRLYNQYALFSIECQILYAHCAYEDDCFSVIPYCAILMVDTFCVAIAMRSSAHFLLFVFWEWKRSCSINREQKPYFSHYFDQKAYFSHYFISNIRNSYYYGHFLCMFSILKMLSIWK